MQIPRSNIVQIFISQRTSRVVWLDDSSRLNLSLPKPEDLAKSFGFFADLPQFIGRMRFFLGRRLGVSKVVNLVFVLKNAKLHLLKGTRTKRVSESSSDGLRRWRWQVLNTAVGIAISIPFFTLNERNSVGFFLLQVTVGSAKECLFHFLFVHGD